MKRGIVVVLALLATAFVQPASAAPRSYVYEIVRLDAKAWPSAYVRVRGGTTGPGMAVLLEPDDDGGYRAASVSASTGGAVGGGTIDLSKGRRYFVASGSPLSFHINERYWGARPVRLGFRWVGADAADRRQVGPATFEQFERATAPSGGYGSIALANVPCRRGAGAWTLRTDADPPPLAPKICVDDDWPEFAETRRGRSWILEGPVYGTTTWPYRLMVLDYPKR